MSVEQRPVKGYEYLYFYPGRGKRLYLGPVKETERSKINADNVMKALEYIDRKLEHYSNVKNQLVSLLPEEQRREYLQKEERLRLQEKGIAIRTEKETVRRDLPKFKKGEILSFVPKLRTGKIGIGDQFLRNNKKLLEKAELSKDDLAKAFDRAIVGLYNDSGDDLMELGALLYQIGSVKTDADYLLAADSISIFGEVINDFRPLIVGQSTLKKSPSHANFYKTAKFECKKALRQLKYELCGKDKPDFKNVATSCGMMTVYSKMLKADHTKLKQVERSTVQK